MQRAALVALVLVGCVPAQEPADSRPSQPPAGMVLVPGGKYRVGMDAREIEALANRLGLDRQTTEAFQFSQPSHLVELEDFYIDVNEVTNKWWAAFIRDTQRDPPKKWRGDADSENLPVTNVSYDDAADFLAWCGRRLPTEFEWEAAGRHQRAGDPARGWWPWGDADLGEPRCNDATAADSALRAGRQLVPVASFPRGASILGLNDLAGNVLEMTSSAFVPYPGSRLAHPAFSGSLITLRGGCAGSTRIRTATTMRTAMPFRSSGVIGFRSARSRARGRDLLATLTDGLEVQWGLAAVLDRLIDRHLGSPKLALDSTRCAALISGGWDPVLGVPSRARFVGVACRETLSLCDSAEIARLAGEAKRPVMVGCFTSDVDFVKPKMPAGKYWVMCELDRRRRREPSVVMLQSMLDATERHEVPLLDPPPESAATTALKVTEGGRKLSVVLSFPCSTPDQARFEVAFQLEAADGALVSYQ